MTAGFWGGVDVASGDTVPVEGPSRDLDSAVELLEHVGGTQLLATVISHQLLKVIDQTVEQ